MKNKWPVSVYEQMGIAAMLPGMQHMYELMGREIARLRGALATAQGLTVEAPELEKQPRRKQSKRVVKRRPSKTTSLPDMVDNWYTKIGAAKKLGVGISTIEKQIRDGEMKKKRVAPPRGVVSRVPIVLINPSDVEKLAPVVSLHPRDAAHPKHEQWLKKMRRASRKYHAALTREERSARAGKMIRGRQAAITKKKAEAVAA